MGSHECFVLMPFGTKPFPDGTGRTYDFDKVYRVVIQRAVREAGMVPVRADERIGPALIHSEMFRDLRDRAVVLADLSLDNPNVFYELGIRHVMSSNGTVLICRRGSALPFDVNLSRVIFYEFDGVALDWEEVERVVKDATLALQEAQKGLPDSPVHALLETVLRDRQRGNMESGAEARPEDAPDAEPLTPYQELLAGFWSAGSSSLQSLFEQHSASIFGARALAHLVLDQESLPELAKDLANHLNDEAQYRLANQLYTRLHKTGRLTGGSLLAYASSFSEAKPDVSGADGAIAIVKEELGRIEREHGAVRDNADAADSYAAAYRRLAGLLQWKWQLTHDPEDLDQAIRVFDDATTYSMKARDLGVGKLVGFLAQSRMKQMLLLRIRDQNIDRPDTEHHRDAILALHPESAKDPSGSSYLGWFQAIALADIGSGEQAQRKALDTFAFDAKLRTNPKYREIGRRQYMLLRRFLEQFGPQLHNPTFIGRISQVLQAGNSKG